MTLLALGVGVVVAGVAVLAWRAGYKSGRFDEKWEKRNG